ncbi:hypothetical protein B0H13DRAFT_2513392 [Mycena leptocephala]|nr:hypothetical protein B0H13DRAFT_2513392 [Mycena leptocephala]
MLTLAGVYQSKSEYNEAHNINTQILRESSMEKDSYLHVLALLNIVQLDIFTGAPKTGIQRNINTIQQLLQLHTLGDGVQNFCALMQAELDLTSGDMFTSKVFQNQLKMAWGQDSGIVVHCLERLGDTSHWTTTNLGSSWTIVFLVHSLKAKQRLNIHKALQFLGDVLLTLGDVDTAVSLFTVALEGFTCMDVHCSRAQCVLRLGDISKKHNVLSKAVELWETARPLFERSSQTKQVEQINQRLASVGEDMVKAA